MTGAVGNGDSVPIRKEVKNVFDDGELIIVADMPSSIVMGYVPNLNLPTCKSLPHRQCAWNEGSEVSAFGPAL